MPSFDISSTVDLAEVKNAVLQARKELQTRFDFKNVSWEIAEQKEGLVLAADDEFKLQALSQIVMGKLAKRSVSLKNIDSDKVEVSSVGRARQVLKIKQGIETAVAKDLTARIKSLGLKVQAQIQEGQVRVSGKNRDDLQAVIQSVRAQDWPVGLQFGNFRD